MLFAASAANSQKILRSARYVPARTAKQRGRLQSSQCHVIVRACVLCRVFPERTRVRYEQRGDSFIPCPSCGKKVQAVRPFHLPAILEVDDDDSVTAQSRGDTGSSIRGNRRSRAKRHPKDTRASGDDLNGLQPKPGYRGMFLEHCDNNEGVGAVPSAKLETTMEYIRKWQREAPDDKIIGKLFATPF